MPVHDYHPAYLREAVESIFRQTSADWRLAVIVEAGRRGELARVLADALGDRRTALVGNEGRGLAGAFNTGMRRASTEFVAILLGDDMWSPDAVEVLTAQIIARPHVDFFHSSRRVIAAGGEQLGGIRRSREDVRLADFASGSPVKHLMCWRRPTALALGGMDESLRDLGVDDFDFPWTMAEHGVSFHAIPECLYVYRDHRACFRLTTHVPRNVQVAEMRRILRKHGVGLLATERQVVNARRSHLRQCAYRSSADRWIRERLGLGPRRVPSLYAE
jgi:glycosyltransferase involved in cell wall biosynthesis